MSARPTSQVRVKRQNLYRRFTLLKHLSPSFKSHLWRSAYIIFLFTSLVRYKGEKNYKLGKQMLFSQDLVFITQAFSMQYFWVEFSGSEAYLKVTTSRNGESVFQFSFQCFWFGLQIQLLLQFLSVNKRQLFCRLCIFTFLDFIWFCMRFLQQMCFQGQKDYIINLESLLKTLILMILTLSASVLGQLSWDFLMRSKF